MCEGVREFGPQGGTGGGAAASFFFFSLFFFCFLAKEEITYSQFYCGKTVTIVIKKEKRKRIQS